MKLSILLAVLSPLIQPVFAQEYGGFKYYAGKQNNFDLYKLMCFINDARQTEGAKPLKFDTRLACAADKHCKAMAKTKKFAHSVGDGQVSDRMESCGFEWSAARENQYMDDFQGKTENAHHALMNSPGHRANILATDVDRIGVSVCSEGDKTYWVQVFGKDTKNLNYTVFEPIKYKKRDPLKPFFKSSTIRYSGGHILQAQCYRD